MPQPIQLSYRGHAVDIDGAQTLGQLRQRIEQQHGIPARRQKLLYRGLLAADHAPVAALVPAGAKIVLMGTPHAELAALQAHTARRQHGRANHAKYQAAAADVIRTATPGAEYGFGELRALDIAHRRGDAQRMLARLAGDEGVRQVMSRHRFAVGELRELHPDQRAILGYNRNRGQVVALRLRTDDLAGFRDYAGVRRVLMHELAHMLWDAHDENFHRLNRQLCREVVELDWTRRGRTLAARSEPSYEPPASDDVDGGALGAAGFVLGGPAVPSDAPSTRREHAYLAYMKRQSKR
ncbi:hypothetical protein LPJ63_003795 [Coemansia sp. RSA 2711]|nr:hypothetical protein LPJ63_003795 [Coemansia sp. RSA 2711]